MIERAPPLRILLVEDSADDAELTLRALRDGELVFESRVVATEAELQSALSAFSPDLILADWALPGFSGAAAVAIALEWDSSVPCILVSGTLGEELVVEAMRSGATDYVLKQRLHALVPAVQRALREAAARRERAELTLQLSASQALLVRSLDAMADPFLLCSVVRGAGGEIVDFRVELANSAAGTFMGVEPARLRGMNFSGSPVERLGDWFVDACRSVAETGEAYSGNSLWIGKGDSDSAEAIAIDALIAGQEDGFFVTFRDVSERERHARDRERLAGVIERSPDGVVISSPKGEIEYANPAFAAQVGLRLGDLTGRATVDVIRGVLEEPTVSAIRRALTTQRPWLAETDLRQPNGTTPRTQISVVPFGDRNGSPASHVTTFRDVTELRGAQFQLSLETQIQAALAKSLHSLREGIAITEVAQNICDGLVKIPFIDAAVIEAFLGPADVQVIGVRGPAGYPTVAGDHLPPTRAARTIERARGGPWAAHLVNNPSDGGWTAALLAAGLRASAHGPIIHGATVVGSLLIGTCDERFAKLLVEKMPAVMNASTTSSALLAERLHALRRQAELRTSIETVLSARSFHPVFQRIVDLESRETIGVEALTRFDSGQRPDLCFADAWSVGLGPNLEMATLVAAVAASQGLPAGLGLSLNISPRLLADSTGLGSVLGLAERPIILEITEHEVIGDYLLVQAAVRALGPDVRLAVDDAGSGVANFGHIIELKPDLVKLDISLVRQVNVNVGRQAMVVAMRHFSRTAGCRLIAEGIETEKEARTLVSLGVEFGQGYLFGYPETIEQWLAAPPKSPGRRIATTRPRLATALRRTSEPKTSSRRQAPHD